MRDICNKCGLSDRYEKGNFSYCRPCHTEAQKRYMQRRALGESVEMLKAPSSSLSALLENKISLNPVCSKGHPLSGDNVRVSSQRNGRHLRRMCKACERNAKRVKYGLAPEPDPVTLSALLDQ